MKENLKENMKENLIESLKEKVKSKIMLILEMISTVQKNEKQQVILASLIVMLMIGVSPAMAGNGTVIMTFDDGWTNTYDVVKPILDSNNQKAVVFVLPEPVEGQWTDYMTLNDLSALYNDGWDVSSHSYTHGSGYINMPSPPVDGNWAEFYLTRANNSELKKELGNSKDWLDQNGFTRSSMFFSYPFGTYDNAYCLSLGLSTTTCGTNDLPTMIKSAGYYIGARSIDAYSWRHAGKHPKYKLSDPDVLKMATLSIDNTPATYPSAVMDEVNKTISENGLLVITFHKVVDGEPVNAEEYNKTNFTVISNYLKNATTSGSVNVTTFSQYFQVPNPIPTYMPSTPSNGSIIIGKDWINVSLIDGPGYKTDVFDVLVNSSPIYDVVNRYVNVTGLSVGTPINIQVYAINRSWGWTTKNNTPLIVNVMIPMPPVYIPPTPIDTTLTGSNNLSWAPGIGNMTDYFNYSVNGTWHNSSIDTHVDLTGLSPGNYTVRVYAVNSTNKVTINDTPLVLSKEVKVLLPTYMPPIPVISSIIGNDYILTKWQAGNDGGNDGGNGGVNDGNISNGSILTDLYDVNINGLWINGTTNTSFNATNLTAGNYTLVSVYAVNTTNGRTVNTTPAILNSTIPVPTPTAPGGSNGGSNSGSGGSGSSGSSGSGGSSGGGGGGSFFDPNAEFFERSDADIHNGTVSKILFTKNGLVSEVTVTGIKNYGEVTAVVSLLKKNPTKVPIDNVYKFFTVNIGTIKHENENLFFKSPTVTIFISKANISDKSVSVYTYKNGSWSLVDIEELAGTDTHRYFKLKLDVFSNFAVVLEEPKKSVDTSKSTLSGLPDKSNGVNGTTTTEPEKVPKKAPGFEVVAVIGAISTIYILAKKRR